MGDLMNRNELIEHLSANICEVTFTKVNGEQRVMPCTLREDLLPVRNENSTERKVNENVLSVWVTDANGWRSFRIDSVTDIKVLEEKQ